MSSRRAFHRTLPVLTILALLLSLLATAALPRAVGAQTELIAELSGAAEVPGPGDPDGAGFASVLVHVDEGEVCAFIEVIDIAAASAAHIHEGAAGVAGDIVVTLPTPDAEGFAEGCVGGLDPAVLQAIVDDPAGYYVNVHNTDFPDGALRGQLAEAPPPPVELFVTMTGEEEVPGPGDPDGSGEGSVLLFLEAGEVCVFLFVRDIAAATAAHIHEGAAGVAGDIVVTLPTPDADGIAEGCVDGLDPALLQAIADDPAGYYVNVHNAEYPNGAIRGQLSTEPPPPPACAPGELCNGVLAPGTYTYTGFNADLTFTTVTEWFAWLDEIPSLSLYDPELEGGLFAFPFTGGVFDDPCDFESGSSIGTSPAELMDWLTSRSFLATSAPTAVEYGGASGLQIDVSAVTLPPGCDDPPWVLLFVLPIYGDFHFEATSVARIVALEVEGQTILFIAESWGSQPSAFLVRAQGVLDSMIWSLDVEGPPPATPGGSPRPSPTPILLPDTAVPPAPASEQAVPGALVAGIAIAGGLWFAGRMARGGPQPTR